MVGRPPLERWTRPELEDHFHELSDKLAQLQKTNMEQAKQITTMSSRFRRSIEDRRSKDNDDGTVDPVLYHEILKKNELLNMKVKSLKHQLLTYTHPTVRSATASAMTGRTTHRSSSFRPSTRRPLHPSSTEGGAVVSPAPSHLPSSRIHDRSPDHKASAIRITEHAVSEKATIIKLNRAIRGHQETIDEQRIDIQKLNEQLAVLRSQLDAARTALDETTKIKQGTEEGDEEAKRVQKSRMELLNEELHQIRAENNVLKSANERLVRQSLEAELDTSQNEMIELKKDLAKVEEQLREAERSSEEMERRMKDELKRIRAEKNALAKELRHAREISVRASDEGVSPTPPQQVHRKRKDKRYSDEEEEEEEERRDKDRKKRKGKKDDRDTDGMLKQLYADVSGLIKSSQIDTSGREGEFDSKRLSQSRWQQMYAELYEEVEKLRNMLLIQHDIAKKEATEIAILKEERQRILVECEKRVDDWKKKAMDRQKKIVLLEQQIRDIAYSGQKELPIEVTSDEIGSAPSSSELSVTIKTIRLLPDEHGKDPASSFFLSLEFFDFELQTTPMSSSSPSHVNFTSIYDVVVSQLFIHYLQTSGMTIEMYRPSGAAYALVGAGALSLSRLFSRNSTKKVQGEVRLLDIGSGRPCAIIEYEASVTRELGEAIAAFRRQEAAQKRLPIEVPPNNEDFNRLNVTVNKCYGVDKVQKALSTVHVCIVYELAAFSPFFTKFVPTRKGVANISSRRTWHLPATAQFHAYLAEAEAIFYLVEEMDSNKRRASQSSLGSKEDEGVLAMLSLPLIPLTRGQKIIGNFRMINQEGAELAETTLEVALSWEGEYDSGQPDMKELPAEEPPRQPPRAQEREVKAEEGPSAPVETPIMQASPQVAPLPAPRRHSLPQELPQPSREGDRKDDLSDSSAYSSPPPLDSPPPPHPVYVPRMPSADNEERVPSLLSSVSQETVVPEDSASQDKDGSPEGEEKRKDEGEREDREGSLAQTGSASPAYSTKESDESTGEKEGEREGDKEEKEAKEKEEEEKMAAIEKQKDQIRSFFGDSLPPIAKPRLSKQAEDRKPLFLQVDEAGGEEGEEGGNPRLRFGDPLTHSIPPSEDSSVASSPPGKNRSRLKKSSPRLSARAPKSLLKERPLPEEEEPVDPNEEVTISIHIDKLYLHPGSPLLSSVHQEFPVLVQWEFLDIPVEECRTPSLRLPRNTTLPTLVHFTREYRVRGRRLSLLKQWVKLGNRLEFSLLSDRGEESDELGVAHLTLRRLRRNDTKTLQFYDRDDLEIGELEVIIEHTMEIDEDDEDEEEEEEEDEPTDNGEDEIDVDIGKILG